MRIVDAHHHLWDPRSLHYGLLDGRGRLASLARPVLSAEFDAVAHANGISAAIVVEAASAGADPRAETEFLVRETAASPISTRIVAYAPVESPDLDDWLGALSPRVVGIRRSFESVPDGFMGSPAVLSGLRHLGHRGLPFDLVLFADRLGEAVTLVRQLPEVTFVLDHLGKPRIDGSPPPAWNDEIEALAGLPNVVAKVSGLLTESETGSAEEARPYVEHAIRCFGWQRLMFGSDWPISELAGGYAAWLGFCRAMAAGVSAEEQAAFFAGTAERTYRRARH
jgi:L-fuconolactonase